MTDADLTLRDEVAEVLCRGTGDRQCINYDPDVEGGCSWCTRDADALLPLLARVREEGRRDGAADVIAYPEKVLEQARREGEARVRARVEANPCAVGCALMAEALGDDAPIDFTDVYDEEDQ